MTHKNDQTGNQPGQGMLLRFPIEQRQAATLTLLRQHLPKRKIVERDLIRCGLPLPPRLDRVRQEGRFTGERLLNDLFFPESMEAAQARATAWFAPLLMDMLQRITAMQDARFAARHALSEASSRRKLAAISQFRAWRTGTRLLTAWGVVEAGRAYRFSGSETEERPTG